MIGFICVMHKSDLRINGFDLINNLIKSLYEFCKKDFILYLFDNSSDEKYELPDYPNIVYEYIEDQFERGLERPSNDGVMKAVKDKCDIIVHINDDVILNESINDFLNIIENHKFKNVSMYGPLTNKPLNSNALQFAKEPGIGLEEITNYTKGSGILNGFLLAFTREFYEKFKLPDGKLWHPKYLWGGGEGAIRRRTKPFGARFFIIKKCWVFHHKIGGWRKLPKAFPGK